MQKVTFDVVSRPTNDNVGVTLVNNVTFDSNGGVESTVLMGSVTKSRGVDSYSASLFTEQGEVELGSEFTSRSQAGHAVQREFQAEARQAKADAKAAKAAAAKAERDAKAVARAEAKAAKVAAKAEADKLKAEAKAAKAAERAKAKEAADKLKAAAAAKAAETVSE